MQKAAAPCKQPPFHSRYCSLHCLCRAAPATSAGHSPTLFTSAGAAGQGSAGQAEKGSTAKVCEGLLCISRSLWSHYFYSLFLSFFGFVCFLFFLGEMFVILIKIKKKPNNTTKPHKTPTMTKPDINRILVGTV